MLKDRVTITITSGKGGHGSLTKVLEFSTGGDGGNGGNIYIKGDENIYDLASYDALNEYKADRGEDGAKRRRTGSDGKDVVLRVPLTTEVHIANRTPYKIEKHGELFKVLEGGKGGIGSISATRIHYKQEHFGTYSNVKEEDLDYMGVEGEQKQITLILKLQSDIILIGYPNAGKSSLLNIISDAKVKVASYAFTTLEPQLGMFDGIKVMDLPGLIEGTFEGKGLGTNFVKHTEYAKLVAHVVSYENEDMIKAYNSMRKELQSIDPKLCDRPEIIILTKSDEVTPAIIKKTEAKFTKLGLLVASCSIIDDDSLANLKLYLRKCFDEKADWSYYKKD